MRGVLDDHKAMMKAKGMPVIEQGYVPYVYSHGAYKVEGQAIDTGFNHYIEKMFPGKTADPIAMSRFMSKAPGSEDWFPYAYQSMQGYLGSAQRHLGFWDFKRKWGPMYGGWEESEQYPELTKAMKGFYEKMFSAESSRWNENMVNKLVNYTYFAQLWGNMRSAVLHLGKVINTPTEHGFEAT